MTPQQIADIAAANAQKARDALKTIDPESVMAKVVEPLAQAVESNSDLIAALAARTGPVTDTPPITEADAAADEVGSTRPDNPTTSDEEREAVRQNWLAAGRNARTQGAPRMAPEGLSEDDAAAWHEGYDSAGEPSANEAASDDGEQAADTPAS